MVSGPSGAASAGKRDSVSEHNRSVAEAIKEYCRFPHHLGFAVMVDGRWGCGKTHLVRSILDDLGASKPTGRKPLYVSLYGVGSASEIDELIYQQLHPFLAHKYTRLAGAAFKGLMRTALRIEIDDRHNNVTVNSQVPDVRISDLLDGAAEQVVVFDDLERAAMPCTEVLGYINPLVEHDGCKVIILANEEEIPAGDGETAKTG